MHHTVMIFLMLFSALMFPINAYAYLDPGTGSALIQGILGALAAIGVVLKLYWHRLLRLLGIRKATPAEQKKNEAAEKSSPDSK